MCRLSKPGRASKFPALKKSLDAKGYISTEQLMKLAAPLQKSGYGDYLMTLPERVAKSWK